MPFAIATWRHWQGKLLSSVVSADSADRLFVVAGR